MTKYIAVNTIHYDDTSGERQIAVARGRTAEGFNHGIIAGTLDPKHIKELEKQGAIRVATKAEIAEAAEDEDDAIEGQVLDASTGGDGGDEPALAPKHVGGGKWVAVRSDDDTVVVSPADTKFDSKAAAQTWIDENEDDLLS